jgi:hypothetical protein
VKLTILALCLLSATALAAPTPILVPPAGWTADPEQAAAIIAHEVGDQKPAVEVYVPRQPGVALIASRFSAPPSGDAARGAIDDLYGAADRAKIINTNVSVLERADHYDAARKEVVATQSVKGDTTTVSRLVIAMDTTHITAALGECVIRDDANPAQVEACKAALVTLDPAIANRVAIVVPASTAPVLEGAPSHPSSNQPTMSDGSRVPMPPIQVPQDAPASSTDRRPIYVGAGLVVLAVIFWWNRRMRDKFEKEPAPRRSDDDADDLAAAAKGQEGREGATSDER